MYADDPSWLDEEEVNYSDAVAKQDEIKRLLHALETIKAISSSQTANNSDELSDTDTENSNSPTTPQEHNNDNNPQADNNDIPQLLEPQTTLIDQPHKESDIPIVPAGQTPRVVNQLHAESTSKHVRRVGRQSIPTFPTTFDSVTEARQGAFKVADYVWRRIQADGQEEFDDLRLKDAEVSTRLATMKFNIDRRNLWASSCWLATQAWLATKGRDIDTVIALKIAKTASRLTNDQRHTRQLAEKMSVSPLELISSTFMDQWTAGVTISSQHIEKFISWLESMLRAVHCKGPADVCALCHEIQGEKEVCKALQETCAACKQQGHRVIVCTRDLRQFRST